MTDYISEQLRASQQGAPKRLSESAIAWLLIAPTVAFLIILTGWPVFESIRLSFTEATFGFERYVGIRNFTEFASSEDFRSTLVRTITWVFLALALKMTVGLIAAIIMCQPVKGMRAFRLLLLPPWAIPVAIGCFSWLWLYNGSGTDLYFPFVEFEGFSGGVELLGGKGTAFFATVVTEAWFEIPLVAFFLLVAIQSIPTAYYDAAHIDGAASFYCFWRITLPLIMPTMIYVGIVVLISTLNSFETIWILTEGGPANATRTMMIEAYDLSINRFRFGKGAAVYVIMIAVMIVFCFVFGVGIRIVVRKLGARN